MPEIKFKCETNFKATITYNQLEKYMLSKGWERITTKYHNGIKRVFENKEYFYLIVLIDSDEWCNNLRTIYFAEKAIKLLADLEDDKTLPEVVAEIESM